MTESLTFIDGDSILFSSCYGDKTSQAMAESRYREKVEFIKTNTFADKAFVAVKGKGNFRNDIYPNYKGTRPKLDEHYQNKIELLRTYAVEQMDAVVCDGWEADDQVVAWAYLAQEKGYDWVISGIDKDLLQYPGNHFNYGGSVKKPIPMDDRWTFVTPEDGWNRFCMQLLTGDNIDNIIGIKGVGPKKAEKALAGLDHKPKMHKVVEMYKDFFKDQWELQLILNCHMIYMRRWIEDEFNYKDHM